MPNKNRIALVLLSSIFLFEVFLLCPPIRSQGNRSRSAIKPELPEGIPRTTFAKSIPRSNPFTKEKAALGEKLFFDKRLSADGTVSCAVCHDPATAFASKESLAVGVADRSGTRNAPTLLNVMFSTSYFWDGRAVSLEEQAKQPLLNPVEMAMESEAALVQRLISLGEYNRTFERVFGKEGITIDTIVKAIATFERTLLAGNSPFDRFISGDWTAISAAQRRGWKLFNGKAGCIECHAYSNASPFFTDFKFYNSGVGVNDYGFLELTRHAPEIARKKSVGEAALAAMAHQRSFSELGRFLVTREFKDIGAFKTPTLRNIELTTPYMHNGSIKTLLDVVRFYNRGGERNPNLDEKLRPLNLTDEEMSELVEFMRTLTSDAVLRQVQSSKPQTRIPVTISPNNPTLRQKRR